MLIRSLLSGTCLLLISPPMSWPPPNPGLLFGLLPTSLPLSILPNLYLMDHHHHHQCRLPRLLLFAVTALQSSLGFRLYDHRILGIDLPITGLSHSSFMFHSSSSFFCMSRILGEFSLLVNACLIALRFPSFFLLLLFIIHIYFRLVELLSMPMLAQVLLLLPHLKTIL